MKSVLVLLAVALTKCIIVAALQTQFKLKGFYGEAVVDKHLTSDTTESSVADCLNRCLKKCRCKSFQICNGTECTLAKATRSKDSAIVYKDDKCNYYEFPVDTTKMEENDRQQCGGNRCLKPTNCCRTSIPCHNGGTCYPYDESDPKQRFSCKCVDGYYGRRCGMRAQSCAAYAKKSLAPGTYTILHENVAHKVYCDFDNKAAWTLVMSYTYRDRRAFGTLMDDATYNEKEPNWVKYRLGKSMMRSIQNDSVYWRITCQYENSGHDKAYMGGSNKDVDILDPVDECILVKKFRSGSIRCSDCELHIRQDTETMFHFHSSDNGPCMSVTGTPSGIVDYFGGYYARDVQHLCSNSDQSTTQIWFGVV